jgi:hypothetical protein
MVPELLEPKRGEEQEGNIMRSIIMLRIETLSSPTIVRRLNQGKHEWHM